ncbi:MAG: DNA gyrase subunit A, partial [Chloroflexia bacterium]
MEYGIIRPVEIAEEMRNAYLDYAMSVIVARALPDVRDGLKPVQRRIIYVMHQLGLQHNAPFKKSARIVGDTLGRYHPHGDAAVYEAMVRMAQDFTMRYPLVDGQGNFGSIDGDPPAAQRYTEARLTAIAEEMLRDIEKETVDLIPNFDATLEEPLVLPAAIPNLLLNGASGIAVGMATNIPPHNLNEVCAALALVIENPEATTEDLMRVLPGPDFPTGGIILGQEGIRTAYSTGRGHFVVRAKAHIEEATRGRTSIVVTELPYQVNKARLLERIAELVKQDRLTDISDLRDESDRSGMRIVITLKREAQPEVVLHQLFKFTQMQVTFAVNLLALVDGTQPRLLTLKRMLQHYITHRQEVIVRRSCFELDRARNRAHILEGLRIALEHLDEVIETIRRSQNAETAKANLIRRFKLTEVQAQAILDLQLRRLAALERKKIEEEYQETLRRIAELEDILAHPRKVLELIRAELRELAARYGDGRRTRILSEEAAEITAEALIPEEEVLVMVTERGYVRRVALETYRRQRRSRSARTREQDAVRLLAVGNTRDEMLFFSERGRCYPVKVHRLPEAEREARGLPLSNVLSIEPQERIVGMVPVADYEAPLRLVLLTRRGRIKQAALGEFRSGRGNGLAALTLEEGDALVEAALAQGTEDVLVVTAGGQALRFSLDEVRPMGRSAAGVKAISLGAGDRVVGMEVVRRPEAALLVVAADGYGKRVPLSEYPRQGRGGKGVVSVRSGQILAAACLVEPQDEVWIVSMRGVTVRLPAGEVSLR